MRFRAPIPDFQLANPIYVGARVNFYVADTAGRRTQQLATLYAGAIGAQVVNNPVQLDSEGKFGRPVYIDTAVVAVITGASVASHETGVIAPRGTFKDEWAPGVTYFTGDVVRRTISAGVAGLYVASNDYESRATIQADIDAGDLLFVIDSEGYRILFEQTRTLRDEIVNEVAPDVFADRRAAEAAREGAEAAETAAGGSAGASAASATTSQQWAAYPVGTAIPGNPGTFSALHYATRAGEALTSFGLQWYGARPTPPADAARGALYLDTSTTPNRFMVNTDTGWQPSTTVSVGGVRSEDFPQQTYASGSRLPVSGGFTSGDVYIDGRLVRSGAGDITLEPGTAGNGGGSIVLNRAFTAAERIAFRGYVTSPASEFVTQVAGDARYAQRSVVDTILNIFPALTPAIANRYMRVNTPGTAWESRTVEQTRNDLAAAHVAGPNTFGGTQTVPALVVAGNLITMQHANGQRRHLYHDGTHIGLLGNDSGFKLRVGEAGALWTAQLGDLNSRIEARALAHAQAQAATRLPLTGGDLQGNLRLIQTDVQLILHRPGVREWAWHVGTNGNLYAYDRSGGSFSHQFSVNGDLYCNALGAWLSAAIANRAQYYGLNGFMSRDGHHIRFEGAGAGLGFHTPATLNPWRLHYAYDGSGWNRLALIGESDERLKDILGYVDRDTAGAIIDALEPIEYRFKDQDGPHLRGDRYGFGAQTLRTVLPMAIEEKNGEDDTLVLVDDAPYQLLAIAIAEIKSLRARIEHIERNR